MMSCFLIFLIAISAASLRTLNTNAFQCPPHHHPLAPLHVTLSIGEQRRRRGSEAVLLRMTKPQPEPMSSLFQEEKPKKIKTTGLLFQDQTKTTLHIENDIHADEIHKMEDAIMMIDTTTDTANNNNNNKQYSYFEVGDIVQVVIPDLRGYQVPAAGRGRYQCMDDNQTIMFVPDPSLKYLILPVGLRGKVEKVYDPNGSLSANLPIRVSFVKPKNDENDDDNDDAYTPQPPVDFQMYFAASELALVERPR